MMNNGYFGSPGSQHPGGANFGMGDGSVKFFAETRDAEIFALAGSMDDGVPIRSTRTRSNIDNLRAAFSLPPVLLPTSMWPQRSRRSLWERGQAVRASADCVSAILFSAP